MRLPQAGGASRVSAAHTGRGALARPSPEEAATLLDLLEEVLRPFEGPHRRMIELRLQGYPLDAADTGHCRHTVMRVLKRVREHLEQGDATI